MLPCLTCWRRSNCQQVCCKSHPRTVNTFLCCFTPRRACERAVPYISVETAKGMQLQTNLHKSELLCLPSFVRQHMYVLTFLPKEIGQLCIISQPKSSWWHTLFLSCKYRYTYDIHSHADAKRSTCLQVIRLQQGGGCIKPEALSTLWIAPMLSFLMSPAATSSDQVSSNGQLQHGYCHVLV